jgi:hypothetical protein
VKEKLPPRPAIGGGVSYTLRRFSIRIPIPIYDPVGGAGRLACLFPQF